MGGGGDFVNLLFDVFDVVVSIERDVFGVSNVGFGCPQFE